MQQAETITSNPEEIKEELTKYIEQLDEYQARIVLAFIKNLFNFPG